MNKRIKKLPQLTWKDFSTYRGELYGISTLWILIFHAYLCGVYFHSSNPVGETLIILQEHGNMGVEIFFFLSGASLYGAWQHCHGNLWKFYKKRLTRVLVPTWLVWGIYWIVYFCKDWNFGKLLARFLLIQFWTDGDQGVWFVSMILVFYLVYPFLYRIFDCEEKKQVFRLILLMAVSIGWCCFSYFKCPAVWSEWNIAYTRIPVFLLGCYFGKKMTTEQKISNWWIMGSIGTGMIVTWMLGNVHLPLLWQRMIYLSALAFMLLCTWLLKWINRGKLNRFLRFFGGLSLELYLVQILIRRLYQLSPWYVDGSEGRFFAMLLIDVLAAWLAHIISGRILALIRKKAG